MRGSAPDQVPGRSFRFSLVDLLGIALWFVADRVTAFMRAEPGLVWSALVLVTQLALLVGLYGLRGRGIRKGTGGLDGLGLRMMVSLHALILPLLTLSWAGDITGLTRPGASAGWVVIPMLVVSAAYPVWLAWSIVLPPVRPPERGPGLATAVHRHAELLHAAAVTVFVVLVSSWFEQTLSARGELRDRYLQFVAVTLIVSVPRFAALALRYRRAELVSLLLLLATILAEPWLSG